MKLKKVFAIFLIFFTLFSTIIYALETTDIENTDTLDDNTIEIDVSTIAGNFNNSTYVSKLAEIGIKVSAAQTNNSIILNYNNTDSVTYTYDNSTGILTTYYPLAKHSNFDLVNAIFIDTISVMQGNEEGKQIGFALDDSFCYSSVRDLGIEKMYTTKEDGNVYTRFQINPSIKLPICETSTSISENDYLYEYETIYTKEDCFVKKEDMIFYKTYNSDGLLEIYMGQAGELDDHSYDSLLTGLSIIFGDGQNTSEKVVAYFKQNYEGFSLGNFEFNGVTIDTSIESLPVSNINTILLPFDMRYAKIVIDESIVKEELPNVIIEEPKVGDATSKNKNSAPLVFSIVIIGAVIIIMLAGILIRRHQTLD